jgi:hypothetical protein
MLQPAGRPGPQPTTDDRLSCRNRVFPRCGPLRIEQRRSQHWHVDQEIGSSARVCGVIACSWSKAYRRMQDFRVESIKPAMSWFVRQRRVDVRRTPVTHLTGGNTRPRQHWRDHRRWQIPARGSCAIVRTSPTMSLPARPPCPSRFAPFVASPCNAPPHTMLDRSKNKALSGISRVPGGDFRVICPCVQGNRSRSPLHFRMSNTSRSLKPL